MMNGFLLPPVGAGHALPLSLDWWPREDPETAVTILAWPPALWLHHDSPNTGRHRASRGHSGDMLPAHGCGVEGLAYLVGS